MSNKDTNELLEQITVIILKYHESEPHAYLEAAEVTTLIAKHDQQRMTELLAALPEKNNAPHKMFSNSQIEAYQDGFDIALDQATAAIRTVYGSATLSPDDPRPSI